MIRKRAFLFLFPVLLILFFTVINVLGIITGHDEAIGIEMIILGLPLSIFAAGIGEISEKIGFCGWYVFLCILFYINLVGEIYLGYLMFKLLKKIKR